MEHPKIGMYHEKVRKQLKKMKGAPANQCTLNKANSIINQARLHEGEGSVKELLTEFDSNNHSSNRLGYSSKYSSNWSDVFKSGSR